MSKPNWDSAPIWANYLAQNSGGAWNWFISMPSAQLGMWWSHHEHSFAGSGPENPAWLSTCESRPR